MNQKVISDKQQNSSSLRRLGTCSLCNHTSRCWYKNHVPLFYRLMVFWGITVSHIFTLPDGYANSPVTLKFSEVQRNSMKWSVVQFAANLIISDWPVHVAQYLHRPKAIGLWSNGCWNKTCDQLLIAPLPMGNAVLAFDLQQLAGSDPPVNQCSDV